MYVETLGEGEPSVAVVGAIHGDEPCGARAVERLVGESPPVERPAKLIVANERALAAGERYLDADLNRSFPGDPDGDAHERRLAHDLRRAVEGCLTLGIHSTVSFDEPFGTLADLTPRTAEVMRALPIEHAADFTGLVEGRSVNLPGFVNVEAGYQGSDRAADNAYDCAAAFLRATGVLSGTVDRTETGLYKVFDVIEKAADRRYRVEVENFRRVAPGDIYARARNAGGDDDAPSGDPGDADAPAADKRRLRADREFWPVLLSADGHRRLLGYKATRVGEVGAVADRRD